MRFILDFIEENGESPTNDQINAATTCEAKRCKKMLKRAGIIDYCVYQHRGIRIVDVNKIPDDLFLETETMMS